MPIEKMDITDWHLDWSFLDEPRMELEEGQRLVAITTNPFTENGDHKYIAIYWVCRYPK